jgi:ketosteroid isomerase-like protein
VSEKADIVRGSMAAYERGDFDALREMASSDFELHEWPEGPDSSVYRGKDAISEARDEWSKAWDFLSVDITEIIEKGARVFVAMHNTGKGRGSSIELEMRTYAVFTIRDSKITKLQYFANREGAVAAAGLTPDYDKEKA